MMQGYAERRLILIVVLFSNLLLPLWFIVLLATTAQQDSSTWLLVLIAAASHVAYISVAGAWSWFGVYMQRALPLVLVAAAIITRPRFLVVNDSPTAAELRLLSLALALYFLSRFIFALWARRSHRASVELTFPLKDGTFMVVQGGRSRVVNHHVRRRPQRYGIDLVKLGQYGVRAAGLYPVNLKKYAIFGEHVFSPCEGSVVAAVDSLPDNIPPLRDVKNPAGNYVAIESHDVTIHLAHLMKGSVTVDLGQRVRVGQILGRVGNSGNSTEPHLHVHAEKEGVGVPIQFSRRHLVRNDTIAVGES